MHATADCGYAIPKFVIIGQHVSDGRKASNFGEAFLGSGDGRAERKVDLRSCSGYEYAGKKIACDANGFQFRPEIFFRHAPIKTSDCGDLFFRERWNNLA